MSNLFGMMRELPAVVVLATAIYGTVFFTLRRRRQIPSWSVIVAEYALVGWASLFLFVTQFMQFGNGMGALLNLVPFRSFYVAWNYGLVNAESLSQVALNVVITIPLGFLLPTVFPRRFSRFTTTFLLGLSLTVATELSQLFTGRSADIDDVIANSLGAVVGYSIYVVVHAASSRLRRKTTHQASDVAKRPGRLVAAVSIIAVACAPFIAVVARDNLDPVGHVYYGQFLPTQVETSSPLSTDGGESAVYRNEQRESTADLLARLRAYAGLPDACSLADGTWACSDGNSRRLFVYAFNRWSVTYDFGDSSSPNVNLIPDKATALELAKTALRTFQIDPETLSYDGLAGGWGDAYRHLTFTERVQPERAMVWGNVTVTIGENGRVLAVSDERTYNTLYEHVSTISPQASVRIAATVGLDGMPGKAQVSSVRPSFWFNEDTGYLIPTWQFNAEYTSDTGQSGSWTPNVDARR